MPEYTHFRITITDHRSYRTEPVTSDDVRQALGVVLGEKDQEVADYGPSVAGVFLSVMPVAHSKWNE